MRLWLFLFLAMSASSFCASAEKKEYAVKGEYAEKKESEERRLDRTFKWRLRYLRDVYDIFRDARKFKEKAEECRKEGDSAAAMMLETHSELIYFIAQDELESYHEYCTRDYVNAR
ncbi:hypothetical protein ACFLY6_02195 [Candidatus Dependentiae bacterium]